MNYLDALKVVHENYKPSSYVEIGCRFGASLALADCKAIGIDPNMRLREQPRSDTTLFDITSDLFFDQENITELLGETFSLAFVDGMHLAEYALRDFINLEKQGGKNGVVLFDDIMPKKTEFAGREPETNAWCGDVYKVFRILKKYRTDLEINVFDISTKGLGVVSNLNPTSTVLSDNIESIETDISEGVYDVVDVAVLREEFSVRSVSELADFAKTLAEKRSDTCLAA